MPYKEPARAAARRRHDIVLAALAMVAVIIAGCSKAPAHTDNASTGASKSADNREQAVKFSECMRDNGVKDFPDPNASGELTIDAIVNGSSVDPSTPAWQNAIGACKDLQPPGFTGDKRTARQQEAALRFAQCVRDNGVEDFPDPTADGPLIDTNRIPSTAGSGGMTVLNAALQKCRDFAAAAGVTGSP